MLGKLAIACAMTTHMQSTTKACSADGDHLSASAISDALMIGKTFEMMIEHPSMVRQDAARLLDWNTLGGLPDKAMGFTPAGVADLDVLITGAATAAMAKAHHIDDWTDILRRKERYDPRFDHESDCFKEGQDNAGHLGVDPAAWSKLGASLQIMAEYRRFVNMTNKIPSAERERILLTAWWRSHATAFPRLVELACWYLSVPTSSVAAERTFGVMRAMEVPNRRAMKDPTWRSELYLRVNKWLVDELFANTVATLPPPPDVGLGAHLGRVKAANSAAGEEEQ